MQIPETTRKAIIRFGDIVMVVVILFLLWVVVDTGNKAPPKGAQAAEPAPAAAPGIERKGHDDIG